MTWQFELEIGKEVGFFGANRERERKIERALETSFFATLVSDHLQSFARKATSIHHQRDSLWFILERGLGQNIESLFIEMAYWLCNQKVCGPIPHLSRDLFFATLISDHLQSFARKATSIHHPRDILSFILKHGIPNGNWNLKYHKNLPKKKILWGFFLPILGFHTKNSPQNS